MRYPRLNERSRICNVVSTLKFYGIYCIYTVFQLGWELGMQLCEDKNMVLLGISKANISTPQ